LNGGPKYQGNFKIISNRERVQLIFIWLLLTLVLAFHKESPLWVKIAVIPLPLVLVNSLIFDSLLIFLVFVAALLYIHEDKIFYFVLSVIVGTAAILIKFSIAIMGFIFLGSVILAVKRKLRSFLKLISLGVFTISVTFTSIWLLLYGNLEGALAFFWGNKELMQGYSSSMSLEFSVNWVLIWLCIIFFFLGLFSIKSPFLRIVYASSALPLVAEFKYSFCRADVHSIFILFSLFHLCIFSLQFVKKFKECLPVLLFFGGSLILVGWVNAPNPYFSAKSFELKNILWRSASFDGMSHVNASIFSSRRKMRLVELSEENAKQDILPASILNYIGNNSVDIYPWKQTFVYANQLNWKPRKIMQSYTSYTPWLDHENSKSFKAVDSAEHIIFHRELYSVDFRYLLNDEPETVYQILKNYQVVKSAYEYTVLDRVDKPLLGDPKETFTSNHFWGEWIDVPKSNNELIRGKLFLKRKLLGKVKRALYKEDPFFIVYRLEDGNELVFRFIPDAAASGLWLNPFVFWFFEKGKSCVKGDPDEKWDQTNKMKSHIDSYFSGGELLSLKGWVFDEQFPEHTPQTKITIILKSVTDGSMYFCQPRPFIRPDISAVFNFSNGELDHSGFQEILDTSPLHKDVYQLGFLLKHGLKSKIKFTDFQYSNRDKIKTQGPWTLSNVKQIKLNHSSSDFIEDAFKIKWQAIPVIKKEAQNKQNLAQDG